MEMKVAWIGVGRMGHPMVVRLLKAGRPVMVWNRTVQKAAPLAEQGATIAKNRNELADADVTFTMLATGKDLEEVYFGEGELISGASRPSPKIIVDCSTIGEEESRRFRQRLGERGVRYLAAPVSGNPKCVAAGKLSCVVSGPKEAFDEVKPLLETIAPRGVAYVGEGELARACKIAHNVFLAAVIENLIEVTLLAEKVGVPRHAFLQFMNNSVLGSIFTQYKSPALVNLDFTTTFTPALLRKDVDLGLEMARKLGVSMPVTAAIREVLQAHFGVAGRRPDAAAYIEKDFAALIETLALMAGMTLEAENVKVPSGLDI
jgi:3-hydroxyisobutyrate dehydrogenase